MPPMPPCFEEICYSYHTVKEHLSWVQAGEDQSDAGTEHHDLDGKSMESRRLCEHCHCLRLKCQELIWRTHQGRCGDNQRKHSPRMVKHQLKFPTNINTPSFRPNIILWSAIKKHVLMIEVIVPWEEHIREVYEKKKMQDADLVAECQEKC